MNRAKTRGMSIWSLLAILVVAVSVFTLAMSLGPHYFQHNAIVSVMDGISPEDVKGSKTKFRKLLEKRFAVNNLREFDLERILEVERTREGTTVIIEYEVREHIVGNVSAVLNFREQRDF